MNGAAAERRLNLLTGDWILVSPHRMRRPWQGAVSAPTASVGASYDPECYLCPGNTRSGGARNPKYPGAHVFANDFPAVLEGLVPPAPSGPIAAPPKNRPEAGGTREAGGTIETGGIGDVLVREDESGVCRVICYSPDHALTLSRMTTAQILPVVETWTEQFDELAARPDIGSVIIFENRGEMMGASNPHPHGQVWATAGVPNELAIEDARQARWWAAGGETLLASYLRRELAEEERMVFANDAFAVMVPFWAAWPFETLILPRRPASGLDEFSDAERAALAETLGRLTAAYDRLFAAPFPYTMGLHQRPVDGRPAEHFTFHVHFYPPLLRSASVRKFMVGFEMLGMPQRDLTPEAAAQRLRGVL